MEKFRSRSAVNKATSKRKLLPTYFLVLAVAFVLMIVLLVVIFPERFFKQELKEKAVNSHTSLAYLRQLRKQSTEDEALKLKQIAGYLSLDEWEQAKALLTPYQQLTKEDPLYDQVLWLNYLAAKSQFFSEKHNQVDKKAYNEILIKTAKRVTEPNQLIMLADDAGSLNNNQQALLLYKRLFKLHPNQTVDSYLKAARIALSVQAFQLSANYYFIAMSRTSSNQLRQIYFLDAVKALEASGDVKLAFKVAHQKYKQLITTKTLNLFMAKLAMRAGQLQTAEDYVLRVLHKPEVR